MGTNSRKLTISLLIATMCYLVASAIIAAPCDQHDTFAQSWRWWHPAIALFMSCAVGIVTVSCFKKEPAPVGLTEEEWVVVKELRK